LTFARNGYKIRRVVKKFSVPNLRPVIISIAAVMSLGLILHPALPGIFTARADADEVRWAVVNIPAEGTAGGWKLAAGSDVKHPAAADDGTFYCYASPSATSYTLFKSTDGGMTWSFTGDVRDTIVDIATVPGEPAAVYYATATDVYKSADAGATFTRLTPAPGGAGTGNITITCIAIAGGVSGNIVAAGTADSGASRYGGVYTLDESILLPSWADTGLGSYDVRALAFSPAYPSDRQLVAVVTDELDTVVTSRIDSGGWGQVTGNAVIDSLEAVSAEIGFPGDYNAAADDRACVVGVNPG
jgi:hypothetical protein